MKRMPQAMVIVDPRKEEIAIKEARILGIPVFGIVDTNCDPDMVDYVIPGNDDAVRSVKLLIGALTNAIAEVNGNDVIDYVSEDDKAKAEKRAQKKENAKEEKVEVVEEVKEENKEEVETTNEDLDSLTLADIFSPFVTLALSGALIIFGPIKVAKSPKITRTTISSISVNPGCILLFFIFNNLFHLLNLSENIINH